MRLCLFIQNSACELFCQGDDFCTAPSSFFFLLLLRARVHFATVTSRFAGAVIKISAVGWLQLWTSSSTLDIYCRMLKPRPDLRFSTSAVPSPCKRAHQTLSQLILMEMLALLNF